MPRKFSEADLQLAIQAKQRNPELSYRKLATIYSICATILKGRIDQKQLLHIINMGKRKLTQSEEDTIARRVIKLDSRAFPPRMRYVEEIANLLRRVRDASPVGKNWASSFVRRRLDLRSRLYRRIDYAWVFNEDPIAYRI